MEITVNEHKMANIAEAILARTDRGMSDVASAIRELKEQGYTVKKF